MNYAMSRTVEFTVGVAAGLALALAAYAGPGAPGQSGTPSSTRGTVGTAHLDSEYAKCEGKKCQEDNCSSSGSIRGCYQCCLDYCNSCATTCQDGCDGTIAIVMDGDWNDDDQVIQWLAHTDYFDTPVLTGEQVNTLDAILLDDERTTNAVRWALVIAVDRYNEADEVDTQARWMIEGMLNNALVDQRDERIRFLAVTLIGTTDMLYESGWRYRLLEVVADQTETKRVRNRAIEMLTRH